MHSLTSEILRISAFGFCLACVSYGSLAWIRRLKIEGVIARLLAFAVLNCVQIIIAIQALSLMGSIRLSGLLLFHGATVAILLVLKLKPPELVLRRICEPFRKLWTCSDIPLKALLACTVLAAMTTFMLVVGLPPNNHDSMTYHLARVGYYLQQGSLKSFSTANLRQTVSPANSEMLILWHVTLLNCDRLAGLVQWLSWIGCVLAIYGIARQLRAPPKGALFAALAFASFPEVVLQSSTTQSDLTTAFFLVCAFFFVGEARKAPSAHSLLCGASLGLAVGAKILSFLMLLGFGIYVLAWYFHEKKFTRRDILRFLFLCLIGCVVLGSYIYLQNFLIFGHIAGPPQFIHLHSLDSFEWHTAWSNLGRLLMQFLDPNGVVPPWQPIRQSVTRAYQFAADNLFNYLQISKHLPGRDMMDASWSRFRVLWMHEDLAMFGPIFGYLGLATLLWQLLRPGSFRETMRRRSLALASILFLILMAATLRWQPTSGRLLVPMVAVGTPLLACLYSHRERWASFLWNLALSMICIACLLASLLLNQMKPLLGKQAVWGKDRIHLMARNNPNSESMARFVDRVVPDGARLGFVPSTGDSFEYLLFGRRFERKVIPVRIDKKELLSLERLPPVEYLLLEGEWQEPFHTDESDIPETQFGFGRVALQPLLAALRAKDSGWHPVFDIDGHFHFFAKGRKEIDTSVLPESLPGEWNRWSDHWVKRDFVANVRVDPAKPSLRIRGDVPDLGVQPLIRIEGPDQKLLETMEPAPGRSFESTISLLPLIPDFSGKYVGLRFQSNLAFNPKKTGRSEDDRDLSWRLYEYELTSWALADSLPGEWNKWSDHWVKNDFVVKVRIDAVQPWLLVRGSVPDLGLQPKISVEGPDGKLLGAMMPAPGPSFEAGISLASLMPEFSGRYAVLRFRSNLQFNPKKLGRSTDSRDLSWRLYEFKLGADPSAR